MEETVTSPPDYEPSVSIIIPTWRDPKVLDRCLKSLERMDYPPDKVEIILVAKEELAP